MVTFFRYKSGTTVVDIIPCYIKARIELFNLNNGASLKLANYLKQRINNIHSFNLPAFTMPNET